MKQKSKSLGSSSNTSSPDQRRSTSGSDTSPQNEAKLALARLRLISDGDTSSLPAGDLKMSAPIPGPAPPPIDGILGSAPVGSPPPISMDGESPVRQSESDAFF